MYFKEHLKKILETVINSSAHIANTMKYLKLENIKFKFLEKLQGSIEN